MRGTYFTLLALSYIGSVTARHSSSGRQPNFVAWYKDWNYGTFADSATYSAGRPSRWTSAHILVAFVVLGLVSSVLCQEIGQEERLRNDLF